MWELFSGYNEYGGTIMWVNRKRMGELIEELYEVKEKVNKFVSCETCGCLLHKKDAIRGKSKIVEVIDYESMLCLKKEVIHHPYYCKCHAPKTICTEEGE
jgi:hypothetical protein